MGAAEAKASLAGLGVPQESLDALGRLFPNIDWAAVFAFAQQYGIPVLLAVLKLFGIGL